MAYGQGYAGGFSDTLVPPTPPVEDIGGEYPLHKSKPRRRRPEPVHGEGRATIRVAVMATAGGEGAGTARVDLRVRARAFDPLLQEREDRALLGLALVEAGVPFRMGLPLGQEDQAWDKFRADEEEAVKRRLLTPPGRGKDVER